jgi:hypothetical protein
MYLEGKRTALLPVDYSPKLGDDSSSLEDRTIDFKLFHLD